MASLISTSVSDAFSHLATARRSVSRIGIALLLFLASLLTTYSQVVINEVITDPQQDWSTNGFDGTDGGGTIDSDDDWIELYINANGLDLTGWTIQLNDGTNESGTIAAGGAFVVSNYISGTGGTFTNTDAGDYIVLGQMTSGAINETVTVVLLDDLSAVVDQVIIASGSGTMFTGNASSVTDESVCRIPNGQDTDIEVDDFVKTRATLGADNSPTGVVLINEVVTDPQQDWQGVGFASTPGVIGGNTQGTDEWVELYIATTGLNLTKWTIDVDDGGPFTGDLTSRDATGDGAFQEITYFGSGSFTSTVAGDYLILGNPQGGEEMNNEVTLTLTDPYGTTIDVVEIASASGTGFNGNSNDLEDEAVCRIPNGSDTDVEADDFAKTRATLGANNSPQGTVLINEVVTNPQQDWSNGGFTNAAPGGTAGTNDEWIELYVGTTGLNLTKWIISVEDGTDFSGDLTSSGAFSVVNYVGSGSFSSTVAGDYLILGNPVSTQTIDDNVYITLTDPYGVMVDDVELGDDPEGDGNGDGAPNGLSTGVTDEAVFRVQEGQDTDDDGEDFSKGLASLGLESGVIYVDASAPDDTGLGRQSDPKQLIQSGLDLAVENGSVIVAAGTYTETITISKPVNLRGAYEGLDGNDASRTSETIINPLTASDIIEIDADSVTIDGFQIGNGNADAAIYGVGHSYITIQNNVINADSVGIALVTASTGFVNVTSNMITAADFTTGSGNLTSSLILSGFSGDSDVNLSDNEHAGSALGVFVFDCLSSNVLSISNDTTTSSIRGVSVFSFNGVTRASSSITVDGFSATSFSEPALGITDFPEAGIYFYTDELSDNTHLISATVSNSSFSLVENTTSDYAGIICGDFSNTNYTEYLQDITVMGCTFDSNENRGMFVRGQNTRAAISNSNFTNNGHDPFGLLGNYGFNLIVRNNAEATVTNTFFTSPSTQTTSGTDFEFRGLSLEGASSSLSITGSNFDNNGNPRGIYANSSGIDLSGNFFGTTVIADIDTLVMSNDFTPFLTSGTDTDLVTEGFQGDFDAITVTTTGTQSAGDRIQEAHDLVNTDGTVSISLGDYVESLTVSKNISIAPASGTTIDDVTLNGGNMVVTGNTITIDNSLTMSSGIFDIDQDDGDKSDDPVFILPGTVTGSSYGDDTHFEGRIEASVTGTTSFTFEVGDEGEHRPVTLTPTTTTTFQVAHIEGATPTGGGVTNPGMIDLIGDASANPVGTIESVLNNRYWDIDVSAGGPPGVTNVALQISSGDRASDPADLGMTRFDGADWELLTLVSSTGSDPYVTTASTSSFSEFSIYSIDVLSNPLPVELIDFNGKIINGDVQLNWATLSEVNSDYFQIEHSADGESFEPIGSVDSHGNSSERHNYQFIDLNVKSGIHYYRLRMVDFDGTFEFSSTIQVAPDLSDLRVTMYPNPVTHVLRLEGVDVKYINQVIFYDLQGKIHKTISTVAVPEIQVSDLFNGQYLIRMELADGSVYEGKIVKND